MTTPTTIQPTDLPPVVRDFLAAHVARDTDAALRALAPDATVTDDGRTFHGRAELLDFLGGAGSEYRYTIELTAAQRVDDRHWVAVNHLEGDFPGGVVDLAYRFTLADDLVAELVIAPR